MLSRFSGCFIVSFQLELELSWQYCCGWLVYWASVRRAWHGCFMLSVSCLERSEGCRKPLRCENYY